MSFEAVLWALKDAPTADINEYAVLSCYAEQARPDGRNAFLSQPTISNQVHADEQTVRRAIRRMVARGLLRRGDQSVVAYIPRNYRPVNYDLQIPAEWFSNLDRINAERAAEGLPPITPETRPPLLPAPAKRQRSDAREPAPDVPTTPVWIAARRRPRGISETPLGDTSGVSQRYPGGVSETARGDLEDTPEVSRSQVGGVFETPNPVVPVVPVNPGAPPARSAPDARRASTGSSAAGPRGASGAAGKTKPNGHELLLQAIPPELVAAAQRERLTRRLAVELLHQAVPEELLAVVTDRRPLIAVAVRALADRTPEQVAARALRRWDLHGHASRWHAGQVHSPVGVAITLLEPGRCADPRCDDGTIVDSGEECVRCDERQADFVRERRQRPDGGQSRPVPATRQPQDDQDVWTAPGFVPLSQLPECVDCFRPTRTLSPTARCSDCESAHQAIQRAIGEGDESADA